MPETRGYIPPEAIIEKESPIEERKKEKRGFFEIFSRMGNALKVLGLLAMLTAGGKLHAEVRDSADMAFNDLGREKAEEGRNLSDHDVAVAKKSFENDLRMFVSSVGGSEDIVKNIMQSVDVSLSDAGDEASDKMAALKIFENDLAERMQKRADKAHHNEVKKTKAARGHSDGRQNGSCCA